VTNGEIRQHGRRMPGVQCLGLLMLRIRSCFFAGSTSLTCRRLLRQYRSAVSAVIDDGSKEKIAGNLRELEIIVDSLLTRWRDFETCS
jgi:hypothetical protein